MNNTREEKLTKAFGENFRTIRKARKLTQKSLAFEADVEISQIYRLEKGITNPTVTTIIRLAEALQVPVSALFEYLDSRKKK